VIYEECGLRGPSSMELFYAQLREVSLEKKRAGLSDHNGLLIRTKRARGWGKGWCASRSCGRDSRVITVSKGVAKVKGDGYKDSNMAGGISYRRRPRATKQPRPNPERARRGEEPRLRHKDQPR